MNGFRYIKIHYSKQLSSENTWQRRRQAASKPWFIPHCHHQAWTRGHDVVEQPCKPWHKNWSQRPTKNSTEIGIDLVFSQATSVPNFSKAWEEEETSLSSLVVSCEGRPPNSSLIQVIPESLSDKTLQNNGFTFSCHCGSGSLVELRSKSIGAHLVFAPTRACLWLQSTKPLNEAPQTCQVSLKVLL